MIIIGCRVRDEKLFLLSSSWYLNDLFTTFELILVSAFETAPWTLDDAFLEKHKIDFVAHDDLPYGAGGEEDIYAWLKQKGLLRALNWFRQLSRDLQFVLMCRG